MLVALSSEGLTLLGGVSIIGHSVQVRGRALLERERRIVELAATQGDDSLGLAERVALLARGFPHGQLAFLPLDRDGHLSGSGPLLPSADIVERLRSLGRPVFREAGITRQGTFVLYSLLQPPPGPGRRAPERGVLVTAFPKGPLLAEARSERDGLIGTALLTLILLGYALVGVSQWLGAQLEQREVRASRAKRELELALGHMSDGLCVCDREGRLTVFNPRLSEILDLPPAFVRRGASLSALFETSLAESEGRRWHHDRQPSGLPGADLCQPARLERELRDGRIIEITWSPVAEGGWLVMVADVTDRTRAQKQIAYMAGHDALTGLSNRAAFSERLGELLSVTTESWQLAVLWLDLDHFKQINDEWGHPAGDAVLQIVAERLRRSLREGEGSAFRLGGDEFAVLLAGIGVAEAEQVAGRLLDTLNEGCEIRGRHYQPQISIGIAHAPTDACDADRLMSHADLALYAAKRSGRNTVRSFTPELEQRSAGRATMEAMLQRALAENQLEIWYQPVLDLSSGELVSFEALLRWNHPTQGFMLPSEFIGVAEDLRIIEEIGCWTLERACIEATSWPESIGVAVNISAIQLRSQRLLSQVRRALADSGLAGSRLELEVTETAIIQDPAVAFAVLQEIQADGVLIALDDFGTGYSSLSFLTRFNFDSIKIDRTFVRDMDTQPRCAAIVETLSSLGSKLGLVTIAEGVETTEQLDRVSELGCRRGQGFLLGRPLPAEAARAYARRARDEPCFAGLDESSRLHFDVPGSFSLNSVTRPLARS